MRELWRRVVGSLAPHGGQPLVPEMNPATTVMELALTALALGLGVVLLIHALQG